MHQFELNCFDRLCYPTWSFIHSRAGCISIFAQTVPKLRGGGRGFAGVRTVERFDIQIPPKISLRQKSFPCVKRSSHIYGGRSHWMSTERMRGRPIQSTLCLAIADATIHLRDRWLADREPLDLCAYSMPEGRDGTRKPRNPLRRSTFKPSAPLSSQRPLFKHTIYCTFPYILPRPPP